MKAVLGIAFLMAGFGVAYIVLSGKLPSALATTPTNTTPTNTGTIPTAQNLQQTQAQMINKQGGGGPMGMKVGANANDMYASLGVMS